MFLWLDLANAFIVVDIYELEFVFETRVGSLEFWHGVQGGEGGEVFVAPGVDSCDAGTGTALLVEVDLGNAETDETGEEALVEVGVLF